MVVAGAALVILRVFELEATGWPRSWWRGGAGRACWRGDVAAGARVGGGRPAGYREQLELGGLFVVAAAALVQATAAGAVSRRSSRSSTW